MYVKDIIMFGGKNVFYGKFSVCYVIDFWFILVLFY